MADLDGMLAYRSDPEVCRYLSHPPLDREGVRDRIARRTGLIALDADRLSRGFSVELDGPLIGDGMIRVQRDGTGESAWLGYAFARSAWGQGLATEVAATLLAAARELNVPVWADYLDGNDASARVLSKLGFEPAGSEVWSGRRLHLMRCRA